jgi:hypothetical protein
MPADSDKLQIGIRLSAKTVRAIDSVRGNKTRAEFCRELIEAGLLTTREPMSDEAMQAIMKSFLSVQEQTTKIHQAIVLAQHDASKSSDILDRLYPAVATGFVGVLTKIGQVVRQKDRQAFARASAEEFVKRIFYPEDFPEDEAI